MTAKHPTVTTGEFIGGTRLCYGLGPSVVKFNVYDHGGMTILIEKVGTQAGQPVMWSETVHLTEAATAVLRNILNHAHPAPAIEEEALR